MNPDPTFRPFRSIRMKSPPQNAPRHSIAANSISIGRFIRESYHLKLMMTKMDMVWVAAAELIWPNIDPAYTVSRSQIERKVTELWGKTIATVMIERHLVSSEDRMADTKYPRRMIVIPSPQVWRIWQMKGFKQMSPQNADGDHCHSSKKNPVKSSHRYELVLHTTQRLRSANSNNWSTHVT